MSNHPAEPHRRPARVVLYADRIEDRIPGRAALVVHRSRSLGRRRSIDGMRLLEGWARRRAERLAAARTPPSTDTHTDTHTDTDTDTDTDTENSADGAVADAASDDSRLAEAATPDESWTKGRIYELARTLDLEGRSKLNKADLLEAVLAELGDQPLDGPAEPVYAEPRTPINTSV